MPDNHALSSKFRSLSGPLAGVQGKDYSGENFAGDSIRCQNFFESIFNGSHLSRIRASQSIFQHVEFTETRFSACAFEDSSFDHSDFVLAGIKNSRFLRCSFQNAEWRDVIFENVQFRQCIFRNTTTSLVRFRKCSFDQASAENFVGSARRFTLFSNTDFELASQHLDFLRLNFGIRANAPSPVRPIGVDPLFEISLRRFDGSLSPVDLHRLFIEGLGQMLGHPEIPHRLLLRYLSEICKTCLEEDFLSVFAIQLFHDSIAQRAVFINDSEEGLDILSLVLALRVALRERITAIEEEVAEYRGQEVSKLKIQMLFENTYSRSEIEQYLGHLAAYCAMGPTAIKVDVFKSGSTFVDLSVTVATYLMDVVRFLRYSLPMAKVTLSEAGKVKKEFGRLVAPSVKRAPTKRTGTRSRAMVRKVEHHPTQSTASEIMGEQLESAKPIEVFVDAIREQVLVVNGKVRVTINMM